MFKTLQVRTVLLVTTRGREWLTLCLRCQVLGLNNYLFGLRWPEEVSSFYFTTIIQIQHMLCFTVLCMFTVLWACLYVFHTQLTTQVRTA